MGKIDFYKSISNEKLFIQTSFTEKFLIFCIWIIGAISLPIFSLSMLYGSIKFNWFSDSAIQIIILQLINFGISIFVIIGLIINRNLTKITISPNVNSILLLKDVITIFKKTNVEKDADNELIVCINNGFFSNYRQLIILFDNNDVYLNCMTYARSELISPVHWIIHKRIIKNLIKEIKKHDSITCIHKT